MCEECRELGFELPLLKNVSVPIYLKPPPPVFQEIVVKLKEKYRTVRDVKKVLRENLKCFVSENSIWLHERKTSVINGFLNPPSTPRTTLVVTMTRAIVPVSEIVDELTRLGVKYNPYSSHLSSSGCIGFYTSTYDQAVDVVDHLGSKGLIRDSMVVNAVWQLRLRRLVDLRVLSVGLSSPAVFSETSRYTWVHGVVDHVKVIITNKGTIRIFGETIPERAVSIAGKVYYLINELKAFIT